MTPPVPAGEHDKPGRHRHPGREGGQARVHRPAEEDADAGRGQTHHADEDAESPVCHHDTPAALPSQLTVRKQDKRAVVGVVLGSCLIVFLRFVTV